MKGPGVVLTLLEQLLVQRRDVHPLQAVDGLNGLHCKRDVRLTAFCTVGLVVVTTCSGWRTSADRARTAPIVARSLEGVPTVAEADEAAAPDEVVVRVIVSEFDIRPYDW